MSRNPNRCRILICAALAIASPLAAQDGFPLLRDSLTWSLAAGVGNATVTCQDCRVPREKGLTGYGFIGGPVRPDQFWGVELAFWQHNETGETDTFAYALLAERYYLSPASGVHFRWGVGAGYHSLSATTGSKLDVTSLGLAWAIGLGLDVRVAPRTSLTPFVDFLYTQFGTAAVNGHDTGDALNGNLLRFGVAFTKH